MTTRYELRVLTQDVPNPIHDGRAKYGPKSVKSFKSGTKFVFGRWVEEYGVETAHMSSVTFIGNSASIERRSLVEALVEHSEPVVAATWNEQLALAGCVGVEAWTNGKVVARLYETNRALALELLAEVLGTED